MSAPSANALTRTSGGLWSSGYPGSSGKENDLPRHPSEAESADQVATPTTSPATTRASSTRSSSSSRSSLIAARLRGRDQPYARVSLDSIPSAGCLHEGKGRTWVPGGLKSWQSSKGRFRTTRAQECAREQCPACGIRSGNTGASGFSVQVSSDGRGILVASRDRTVTLFDAQSRQVLFRFGHLRLSTRARPILVEGAPHGGVRACGTGRYGAARGDVFAGTTEGEVRSWRVGSQFPNRVFKSMGHHRGFDVCSLAASLDGTMFASADSSGAICVQSATFNSEK